jgi:hypothetical protein
MFGIEPIVCHLGNGGTVTQPAVTSWPLVRGLALCSISTNTASYSGITSSCQPFYPDATTSAFYFGAVVGLTGLPSGSSSHQRYVIGITPAPANGTPAQGIYFFGSTAILNWQTKVKSGVDEQTEDSGSVIGTVSAFSLPSAWTTFEIMAAEGIDSKIQFYINKLLVAEEPKSTSYPSSGNYFAGVWCCQNGHNSANAMAVDALHVSLASFGGDAGYGLSTGLL